MIRVTVEIERSGESVRVELEEHNHLNKTAVEVAIKAARQAAQAYGGTA